MTDCAHEHPRGRCSPFFLAAMPMGLALCVCCGVHICPEEIAALLEIFRLMGYARGLFHGRQR